MTVTYNGGKITTDTLYEDGTIEVKQGLKVDQAKATIAGGEVFGAKAVKKISEASLSDIIIPIAYSNGEANSGRMKIKIITHSLRLDESSLSCKNGEVNSARMKKVIIVP